MTKSSTDYSSSSSTVIEKDNIRRINPQSLFLSSLGIIHLIAFWSYYVQFPGLLSSSGIEPVRRLMPFAAPWIHKELISGTEIIDEDSLCELCAVLGMVLGSIIASGICHHGLLFAILTAGYSFLVRTGGTFYSFQWDTLLLETTFITSMTFAPWLSIRVRLFEPPNSKTCNAAAPWPLRFLLFKLMYMSGVVKVQANCPTWLQLTALEYHFATQCLPGPLAWHAHQLHPFFLRFSVAITLWLEIPATVLLLVPTTKYSTVDIRRTGAILQIILQIAIILTGSYNFFNLLTMALCLPVMMTDHSTTTVTSTTKKDKRLTRYLSYAMCWFYLLWTFFTMFDINFEVPSIRLVTTPKDVNHRTDQLIPIVIYGILAYVTWTTIVNTAARKSIPTLIHGTICILMVGVVALPLTTLTPTLQQGGFVGSKMIATSSLYKTYVHPHHLSNGYGLFRRMTGVGDSSGAKGWDNLPSSVVARPEIVFEGLFARDDGATDAEADEWQELSFRWKPGGNLDALPLQVAPHQPRLDWQMWFAALGRLDGNPWLIHLVKKLMDGCEPVVNLLGPGRANELLLANKGNLRQLRAKLYRYDFTRIQSEWSETIPGVEFVTSTNASYWSQMLTLKPDKVWSRQFDHDYMPPLEPGNPSLVRYAESHGYNTGCMSAEDRCLEAANSWCWFAKNIRELRLYVLAPLLFILMLLFKGTGQPKAAVGTFRVASQKKNQ